MACLFACPCEKKNVKITTNRSFQRGNAKSEYDENMCIQLNRTLKTLNKNHTNSDRISSLACFRVMIAILSHLIAKLNVEVYPFPFQVYPSILGTCRGSSALDEAWWEDASRRISLNMKKLSEREGKKLNALLNNKFARNANKNVGPDASPCEYVIHCVNSLGSANRYPFVFIVSMSGVNECTNSLRK